MFALLERHFIPVSFASLSKNIYTGIKCSSKYIIFFCVECVEFLFTFIYYNKPHCVLILNETLYDNADKLN